MKYFYLIVGTLMLALSARSEELLTEVSFSSASEEGVLQVGEVTDGGTLRIAAEPGRPLRLLIELANPGITSPVYALKGMIRYEGVEGDGYLQLDNHFRDKGTFFTKSLAPNGPLRKLSGNSDWRRFVLPFYANSGDQSDGTVLTPEKLSLSLYLPGSGTVFIRDVELHQYAAGEDPMRVEGQWVGSMAGGIAGAIGGTVLGIWGALIGFLTSRGKARRFVLGSANVLIIIGIACLAAGLYAVANGQPYAIYYTLLLFGILLVFVVGGLRKVLPRRYEDVELKKMQAMDA